MDLIGKPVGNYIVKSKLGSGGMGTVYLCEHPLLGRKVALKVLHEAQSRDPVTVQRFFTEAKAANDVGNEHIVDVLDFGKIARGPDRPDQYYLEMEYLKGRSLADCLPTLSIGEAVHIARQCCDALGASHAKGIVHRDLKPDNIFLVEKTGDGLFVKLVDFGVAKLLTGAGVRTQMGTILGTPAYMSPEQCEGAGRVDHRSDIYALGVVLYEMVTKHLPFPGPALHEIILGHRREPPMPPSRINPRIGPALESVILRALEKNRERRFQTMAEMDRALADPDAYLHASSGAFLEPKTISAPVPVLHAPSTQQPPVLPMMQISMPSAPATKAPGRGALWIGIGAAAIVAALTAAVLVSSRPVPAPALPPVVVTTPVSAPVLPPPPEPVLTVTPDAPPPPPPATISLRVLSQPSGARVLRVDASGESELGTTPLVISAEVGSPPFRIRIRLDGYVAQTRTVTTDRPEEIRIVLPQRRQEPWPEL